MNFPTWSTVSDEAELREFALQEGGAFGECDHSDPLWTWIEWPFDVARVVGQPMDRCTMDRSARTAWLDEEIAADARGAIYVERLAEILRSRPDSLPPIIVAIHPNDRIEIGDGWHRLVIAVRDDISTVAAVIGVVGETIHDNRIESNHFHKLNVTS